MRALKERAVLRMREREEQTARAIEALEGERDAALQAASSA